MSQICEAGKQILGNPGQAELNQLTETALDLIKTHVFSRAHRVNQSVSVTLTLSNMKIQHVLSPTDLMFEMDKNDLDKKRGKDTTYLRGFYNPNEGKIYLHRDYWCIKTAIHETLHACSVTSLLPKLKKYKPLYEGLTEFYAGYILSKVYCETYENCWRTESNRYCQMTYEQPTTIWSALFHFIPMPYSTNLYFAPDFTNWDEQTKIFVEKIQVYGYPDFENPFTGDGQATHLRLNKQCKKNFGLEYIRISTLRNLFTNFSNIIVN